MTDFRPGDIVTQKGQPSYPDLVVEVPRPRDQRPQFKGHIHIRRLGWVPADEWEIRDQAENDLRREVLAILTRDNQTDNPWTEDEKEAYREFGWAAGATAANHLRVTKIIDAIRKHEGA